MTTPGTIAAPPTAPSKAGVGPLHDTGAKSDAGAVTGEAEEGFGELLSKLQTNGSGESALAKGSARTGERSNMQRHDIEVQLAPEEGADPQVGSLGDFLSGTDLQPDSDPHQQEMSDAPRIQGPGADATTATANGVAALVALNPGQPSVGRGPDAPMRSPTAREAADSEAAPETKVAPKPTGTEARPALPVDGTAKGQVDNTDAAHPATGTDPALARLGAQGTPIDKYKSERVDRNQRPAPAADLSMARVADGATALARRLEIPAATQRPKADVLRQETHFAPVSPTSEGRHAGIPAQDSSKAGTGPEALGGEPVGATSLNAALPSANGSPPVAAPPAQQIADRIATEVASAPELADRIDTTREQPGMKPALKILHIQLQPADLGTVTVRMELKDAELKLHVEAERTETAELIRSDQDTLSKLLRSAGYNVDTASIRVAEGDRTAAAQQPGQSGTQANLQSSPQSQSGASERQEHAPRGSTGPDGDTGPQASRNDTHETTTNRAGLGLYV